MKYFYNDTVTIFNQYIDDDGVEQWYATLLDEVNLIETRGRNITESGMQDADASKLYVMYSTLIDRYLPPKEWEMASEEDKQNYFTFNTGKDFFVKGDFSKIEITEDFYQYMSEKYDSVYKVTTVDDYSDIMKHVEVGGK